MTEGIKKITLNERAYSHQGTGRNGIYYTLVVDGEPLQLDSWMNPDARKYAYLFKAAPDMLEALELILDLREKELGSWLLTPNAKYPTLKMYAEAAIAKAKGVRDEQQDFQGRNIR